MRWFTVVLVAGLVGVRGVSGVPDRRPKKDPAQAELANLQGSWVVMSVNGRQLPPPFVQRIKFLIRGEKLTMEVQEQVRWTGVLKIDPTRNPKRVDGVRSMGGGKARILTGIYELTGGTLKICFGRREGERPKGFAFGGKSGPQVFVCEREKTK
jgi:uncharacterized protein (TIGR03067 family)